MKQNLYSCPSGECMEYTYDGDPVLPDCEPRPVEIIIHTREAWEECERLRVLMGGDRPCTLDDGDFGQDDSEYQNYMYGSSRWGFTVGP